MKTAGNISSLFTVWLEVKPVILVIFNAIRLIINSNFLPTSLHGTVIPIAQIINPIFCPTVIVGLTVTIFINPSIQHLTIIIKSISFAIDGTEFNCAGTVTTGISFTIGLEVVPVIFSWIVFIILIFIYNRNPSIANHSTSGIHIISIAIILNQLIQSHSSIFIAVQPIPVITRFLPLIFHTAAVSVIPEPLAIFLYPASSCEGSHGSANGQQGGCRGYCNYFCLLSHN